MHRQHATIDYNRIHFIVTFLIMTILVNQKISEFMAMLSFRAGKIISRDSDCFML